MIGLRQAVSFAVRRLPQTGTPIARTFSVKPVQCYRPLSVLSATPAQKIAAKYARIPATVPQQEVIPAPMKAANMMDSVKTNNLVFEIGISYTFMHYMDTIPKVLRTLFQAFRPLIILFIFGQGFKAVFFMAGAPIWFSFYSIWLFEVGYSLFQCLLSFLFIAFFYNNLSFARVRPALSR